MTQSPPSGTRGLEGTCPMLVKSGPKRMQIPRQPESCPRVLERSQRGAGACGQGKGVLGICNGSWYNIRR